MTEISPKFGEKFYRPMVEIFAGIPSVVYGWVGLTVLIPFLKKIFNLQVGHSILAASLVLSIMIFHRLQVLLVMRFEPFQKKHEWRLMDLAQHVGKLYIVL